MDEKDMEKILKNHELWLSDETRGVRADLRSANLRGANLRGANLRYAYLRDAYLRDANLRYAYLEGADLKSANLIGADLIYVDLRDADLEGAYLIGADLICANLKGANLRGANLEGTYLKGANLRGANLEGTYLKGANLEGANLFKTHLDASDTFRKGKILTEDILGYKKCKGNVIVTLKIPRGAIVFGINNEKFRTNIATVVNIEDGVKTAYSLYNENFSYHVGDTITVYNFNCQYNIECGEGIHFFMTKEEAEVMIC